MGEADQLCVRHSRSLLWQTLRFVLPGPQQWKLGDRGRALAQDRDWFRRSGKRGGGAGSGYEPVYVEEEVLEQVFRKRYSNKQIKE